MNDSDPIVDEVRRIRDAHAAKFNYDPKAIFQDIKEREKRSGRNYVSFAEAKAIEPDHEAASDQPLQPIVAGRSASGDDQPLPAAPAANL
jgi:hypothetical protein